MNREEVGIVKAKSRPPGAFTAKGFVGKDALIVEPILVGKSDAGDCPDWRNRITGRIMRRYRLLR